jgi:enhancing lycopene biosynthesis protein 2
MHHQNKPIVGLCMGPTVIAQALAPNTAIKVTVGTTTENSPYDIAAISGGMNLLGAVAEMKTVREISVDADHKVITAPCYMMEASIVEVHNNIQQAITALFEMLAHKG